MLNRCRFPIVLAFSALFASFACKKSNPAPDAPRTPPARDGVGAPPARPVAGGDIVIGEFGSMTGATATFGEMTHRGIELAIEEVNAAGGVLGRKVRVLLEDDQSETPQAVSAVKKLIHQDKVVAVLGEVASKRSIAAAPIAQRAKVPMVSPSSTNPELTEKGDYIFRVCFIDPFQGTVMAKFARNTLKFDKIAVLRDVKNDYSVGLANFFTEQFKALGGTVTLDKSYSEGDKDFNAQLTAIKATAPQGIFVPGYYTDVAIVAQQAKKLGLSVPLLGGDGWDSEKLWEIGGESLEGSYFSNHYSKDDQSPRVQKFVTAFKTKYQKPPDGLAAMGYDAAKVLVDAMTRAGATDGKKVRDALAKTTKYAGVTGDITINEKRDAVKPAVVLKVTKGQFQYVETIQP
ncbi:MAG: ABC transporter substrate-binding protein [Deltaproteobacteria bacterium]|nr:ABC transporter substrate-binding protein [Deltaproteobacteria bacterium]